MADLTPTGCCDSQDPIGSPQSVSSRSLDRTEQLAWALNQIRSLAARLKTAENEIDNLKLRALQSVTVNFGTQQVTGKTVANETKIL